MFKRFLILLALSVLTACGGLSSDASQQEQVISGLYDQHLKTRVAGIPGPDELKQLQPFVSRALYTLLQQASDTEAKYRAALNNQAAPMIEGDLFTSLFEGATAYRIDSCETEGNKAYCQVRFTYESKDSATENWKDKVLLVKEDQHWRIDDIEFSGNGQSSHREYLSDALTDVVRQAE